MSLHARVGADHLDVALARHAKDLFPAESADDSAAGSAAGSAAETAIEIVSHGSPVALPNWKAEEALTILIEALTNWRKHAPGSAVTVRFDWAESAVTVTVSDDGPGFYTAPTADGRLGQLTMRERAALIGAAFAVRSHPGAGTTVELTIPVGAL